MKQKPQKLTPGKWPKLKTSEQRAKYFDKLKREKVKKEKQDD